MIIPEIRPEQSVELLKQLHILTRDGKINQDTRRKLKQVYHLYQLIEPLMKHALEHHDELLLVDHGAGKSYLGFILYDLFLKFHDNSFVYGVEFRQSLVEQSRQLAHRLGFERMQFLAMSVEQAGQVADIPDTVQMVTALHACDTATDDAIRFALDHHAQYIVLVPCCQAQVAATMRRLKGSTLGKSSLSELWRHPLHTREFGSHITNVLRCLLLESKGYSVTVTELVGWEHSMKNELILAHKTNRGKHSAKKRLLDLLEMLNLTCLQDRFVY